MLRNKIILLTKNEHLLKRSFFIFCNLFLPDYLRNENNQGDDEKPNDVTEK